MVDASLWQCPFEYMFTRPAPAAWPLQLAGEEELTEMVVVLERREGELEAELATLSLPGVTGEGMGCSAGWTWLGSGSGFVCASSDGLNGAVQEGGSWPRLLSRIRVLWALWFRCLVA